MLVFSYGACASGSSSVGGGSTPNVCYNPTIVQTKEITGRKGAYPKLILCVFRSVIALYNTHLLFCGV